MIRIGVEGSENLLAHYKMTDRPVGRTAKDRNVFRGNKIEEIASVTGGFVEVLVRLNDEVKYGQKLAIQRNSFGDVLRECTAGVDGRVAIIGTNAIRGHGVNVVTGMECQLLAADYAALVRYVQRRQSTQPDTGAHCRT